jgi:hypothetical protein
MSDCTCPEDGRSVPSARRVILIEPNAERREGNKTVRDRSKVHIFDKDCPVHGYKDVTEEGI